MKRIIILLFLVVISISTKAQRKVDNNTQYGLSMTASGVLFTVTGFLTTPDYMWVSSPNGPLLGTNGDRGEWKKKPFLKQGARSMCIVTGFTLTVTGVITMALGY